MRPLDVVHNLRRFDLRVGIIQIFDVAKLARRIVFSAKIERQAAFLWHKRRPMRKDCPELERALE